VDRTRERQILELIKYSEKSISKSLAKEKQLFFNYNYYNDTMTFDEYATARLGVPTILVNAMTALIEKQIIYHDDIFDFQNVFGKISRGENEARAVVKIKATSGKYIFCVLTLTRSLDENGNPTKAVGIITPINAQQEIEVFKHQYQFATTMILREHELLVSFDVETGSFETVMTHVASSNQQNTYFNFYEQSADASQKLIHPDFQESYNQLTKRESLVELYNKGETKFNFEHKRKFGDEDYIYMDLICALIKSETTDKLMAYFYLKNIDEQKRLQLIYQYKSEHDELTKLYNRDTAKKITSDYLAKSTNGMLHSCLLVDLTNLKDINEISGHVFGDQLIENFSDKLKKMFGNSALLSRFTGNQFFLFLPNIPTKEYATEKAKQIVEFFNNSVMRDPKLFASVGIAFYPFDGREFGDLYQATDQALVEAKKLANRQSNYLRTEDITQARLDREALRQADRFGTTENTGMAFETVNKRGAYQYFAKTNLKYWTLTAIITMAVIVLIGALEVIFADQLANLFVNQKIAIFLIPLFTAVLLLTVSLIYFTSKGQIKKILYVDKVTMGNSKMLFDETAENYIKKNNLNYAYVYSNIVNFKLLNERFGSNSGDAVLRNLYGIISSCLEKDEVCGRINNDKFGILVKYDNSQAEVIEKIKRISRLAFRIADDQGVTFGVTTKFGIYFIEDNKEIFSHFSNRAELALTKAVDSDKEIYHVYDTDLKSKLIREKELEGKMQDALFNNNFKVFLQPKVSVSRGIVIGAEALVRWVDHGTLIMPSEFIHIFEENGFITQLDLYMFQEVCRAIKEWETSGKRIVPVSVNVSKKSLAMRDFVHLYKRIMDKYKIDKHFIQFEITETMMIDDFERLSLIISKIHSMGCTCSIDDFGTGFSSLSVLKNVDVDAIKIDRSFFLVSKDDKEEVRR
ncbi:MAG: diguanylate cyclase, partial [Clostridia bacterium]